MRSRSTIRLLATSTSRGAPKSVQQAHRPGRAGQVGRAPDPEPYDGPRAWNLPKPAVRDVPSDPSRRITYCHEAWEGRQYPVPKTLPFRGGGLQQTTEHRSTPTSQSQSCSDKSGRTGTYSVRGVVRVIAKVVYVVSPACTDSVFGASDNHMQPRLMNDRSQPVPVDSGAILPAHAKLISEFTA